MWKISISTDNKYNKIKNVIKKITNIIIMIITIMITKTIATIVMYRWNFIYIVRSQNLRTTSQFQLCSHPFCPTFAHGFQPSSSLYCPSHCSSELGEAGGGTQITVLIPYEWIDVRKNGREDRRRGGLMDCREQWLTSEVIA